MWQGQAGRPNKYDFSINTGPTDVTMTGRMEILNATGICLLSGFVGVRDLAPKMLAAVTGWDVNDVFLKETGLRIFNMRHVFNLREGQKPSECGIAPKIGRRTASNGRPPDRSNHRP